MQARVGIELGVEGEAQLPALPHRHDATVDLRQDLDVLLGMRDVGRAGTSPTPSAVAVVRKLPSWRP